MMTKVWMFLCVFLISGTALADATQSSFNIDMTKAQGLYDLCRGDSNAEALCLLFVAGYDAGNFEVEKAYVTASVSANVVPKDIGPYCPHVGPDPKLMIEIFVDYMARHPEKGSDNWPDALTAALADHWPCKKPG